MTASDAIRLVPFFAIIPALFVALVVLGWLERRDGES